MLSTDETTGVCQVYPDGDHRQKGWTQERLAIESGTSYNTLIKLERNGIKNPKIAAVIKLADALEVSLNEFEGQYWSGWWSQPLQGGTYVCTYLLD